MLVFAGLRCWCRSSVPVGRSVDGTRERRAGVPELARTARIRVAVLDEEETHIGALCHGRQLKVCTAVDVETSILAPRESK